MVVIEPESPSHEAGAEEGVTEASVSNEEEREGFETASEGECGSDGGEEDPSAAPPLPTESGGAHENALADEQSKERALNRANDAKSEGNKLFGAGKYEDALTQYALALQFAPDMPSSLDIRSICHANSGLCYSKLGKYEDAIRECTKALELNPSYLKALLRRGDAHEKLEHYEEAIADMKKVLELDPSDDQSRRSIYRLEPLAAEKREKMKEEMIGKLKEMGNSLLGRFGMSVDNFKAVKDPNTGSYSISFQK